MAVFIPWNMALFQTSVYVVLFAVTTKCEILTIEDPYPCLLNDNSSSSQVGAWFETKLVVTNSKVRNLENVGQLTSCV